MIKAVILDLNGIFLGAEYLSDRMEDRYRVSGEEFWKALKGVLDETRKPKAEPLFQLIQPHLEELGLDISEEEFFDFWFKGEKLNPGALELSRQLREQGIKVFILSNNFKKRTEHYRENLPQMFEAVDKAYFSWETGLVKPDPGAYKAILDEHNLKPKECLYFDDSEENTESAKKVGIRAFVYESIGQIREKVESLS